MGRGNVIRPPYVQPRGGNAAMAMLSNPSWVTYGEQDETHAGKVGQARVDLRKKLFTETAQRCGIEDLLRHKEDAGGLAIPMSLADNPCSCQIENKFHPILVWEAPTEVAVGMGAAKWSGA